MCSAPVVSPTSRVVAPSVVSSGASRRIAGAGLCYYDGLVKWPLQGLLGNTGCSCCCLSLPHLLGLDTDVVNLLLNAGCQSCRRDKTIRVHGPLTSDRQGPGVVMRNPSSP